MEITCQKVINNVNIDLPQYTGVTQYTHWLSTNIIFTTPNATHANASLLIKGEGSRPEDIIVHKLQN